jgi:hypothetical protein
VAEVGHGQLPGGGSWRLQAGRYDRPNPDGKQELVGHLVVASQGQPKASAMSTFEEPVQLAVDASLTYNEALGLPLRAVFGAVSPRAARVVVIPRQGRVVLAPIQAELLDERPGLPARFWVAVLPAGGTPAQTVHQVRSYEAGGRELCRLDPDTPLPTLHRLTALPPCRRRDMIHGWSIRPAMNPCPLPHHSATIFTSYCTVFQEKNSGRLGPMSVIEVRIYTIHEGKREEFVKLFDEVLLPAQRQVGLEVLGQFISLDDQQTFLWLRRFDSQEERRRRWDEFYGSDLWRNRLGPRANPLMKDSSNVIAVEPTPGSAIQ